MFFPFTNYKTVAVDISNSVTVLYTTTARSMIVFEYKSFLAGNDGGISVFNYGSPASELFLFHRDPVTGFEPNSTNIVPAGLEVKRSAKTVSTTRITGTLHIFELP